MRVDDQGLPDATDAETAAHLREWADHSHGPFHWPTDGCGYTQHVRFVQHRNACWQRFHGSFREFVLAYADSLDAADAAREVKP